MSNTNNNVGSYKAIINIGILLFILPALSACIIIPVPHGGCIGPGCQVIQDVVDFTQRDKIEAEKKRKAVLELRGQYCANLSLNPKEIKLDASVPRTINISSKVQLICDDDLRLIAVTFTDNKRFACLGSNGNSCLGLGYEEENIKEYISSIGRNNVSLFECGNNNAGGWCWDVVKLHSLKLISEQQKINTSKSSQIRVPEDIPIMIFSLRPGDKRIEGYYFQIMEHYRSLSHVKYHNKLKVYSDLLEGLIDKRGYSKDDAMLLSNMANIMGFSNDERHRLMEKALPIAKKYNQNNITIDLLMSIANRDQTFLHTQERAANFYDQAIKISAEIGDTTNEIDALGSYLLWIDDLATIENYVQKNIAYAKRGYVLSIMKVDYENLIFFAWKLARYFENINDIPMAILSHKAIIEMAKKQGDSEEAATALEELVLILQRSKIKYYDRNEEPEPAKKLLNALLQKGYLHHAPGGDLP